MIRPSPGPLVAVLALCCISISLPTHAQPSKRPGEKVQVLKRDGGVPIYKAWLEEDVRWIITDEEVAAFKLLDNEEERDQFIFALWYRRDPTPDTIENEFKSEHYRRIAYANERFGANGIPGWQTDRGHVFILVGPPDEIEQHIQPNKRPADEGEADGFPFELWRYRYIEEIGQDVELQFVDTCLCGDYRVVLDANTKKKLFAPWVLLPSGPIDRSRAKAFLRIDHPPTVRFKDLENAGANGEVVSHRIDPHVLPFDVRRDFVRATTGTTLVAAAIRVQHRDLVFSQEGGVSRSVIRIFGRITSLTGRVVDVFEDTVQVDVAPSAASQMAEGSTIYQTVVPLRPGRYRWDIVLGSGDRLGTWSLGVAVPDFSKERISTSSLVLADKIQSMDAGGSSFRRIGYGSSWIRPRVASSDGKPPRFKRDEPIIAWMQVYNFVVDPKIHGPSLTISYDVVNSEHTSVMHWTEPTEHWPPLGDQLTLTQVFKGEDLPVGRYSLRIEITDNMSGQSVDKLAEFSLE